MKIFDLHADIGTHLYQEMKKGNTDVLTYQHLEKLKKGNVMYTSIACYFLEGQTWEEMQETILNAKKEIEQSDVIWIKESKDIIDSNQVSVILCVEGMFPINQDVEYRISWLYEQGVRIASLCWNEENALASGKGGNCLQGLTDLGIQAIKKMNDLNMIIDVSHANEKTFWDIISLSKKPIIATHSNARVICNVERNLSTQQIKAIAQKGGVIGLNAAKNFVDMQEEHKDVKHLVHHAQELVKIGGIECTACGFDFMDMLGENLRDAMAKGLSDASMSQNFVSELKQCFNEQEVQNITHGNAMKFLKNNL